MLAMELCVNIKLTIGYQKLMYKLKLQATWIHLITGKEVFIQDNADFNYLFKTLKNNPDLCRTIVALIKEIEKTEEK